MKPTLYISLFVLPFVACQGVITTYFDNSCVDPIGTFTFALGQCYNNPTFEGAISVSSFPQCSSGVPSLAMSDNLDCAVPSVPIAYFVTNINRCYYLGGTLGILSLKFFCDISGGSGSGGSSGGGTTSVETTSSVNTTPIPISTTTPEPSPETTTSSPPDTTSSHQNFSTSPAGAATTTSSAGAAESTSSTPQSQSTGSTDSGGGLSRSDKIAIGVGLSTGLLSVMVAIIFGVNRWRKKGERNF
jgi:hypothetical protein